MKEDKVRLAVFDCDGTLVDSQHLIHAAMESAFAAFALEPPSRCAVRGVVGLSLAEAVARLLPEGSGICAGDVVAVYRDAFFRLRQSPEMAEPLYPGAREALAELRGQGYLLGVATGKSMRGLRALLERLGMEDWFITLQTPDFNPGKPHPAMLLAAMEDCGAAPCDTVMIGDTSFDMDMAAAARVAGIGVGWGYHDVDELAAARVLVHSFDALPATIDRILNGR